MAEFRRNLLAMDDWMDESNRPGSESSLVEILADLQRAL